MPFWLRIFLCRSGYLREVSIKKNLWAKLFHHKTNNTFIQFFRYVFVGSLGFIVDFSVLFLLTLTDYFKHNYIAAATLAFIFGLAVNYIFSVLWVFHKRNIGNKAVEFLLFALVGVIGLALNVLFIWIFTDHVFVQIIPVNDKQLRIIGSKIISTGIVYFWNFSARKWLLFK